ncbi:MAG: RNA polymerase sigma factor [Lachnospiraceae bacterium]|nr:RNA polymerase sigma factor [Lachnospiraceae bacterium]
MECGRFTECYEKYKDFVTGIAFEKIHDRYMSDDIAQDVFMAFYLNIFKVAPGKEKAWLYRSVKNASIDYMRGAYRKSELLLDSETICHKYYPGAESMERFEKRLDDESLLCRIMCDLKENNPVWYDALWLFCVEGLSCEEAAGRLNISTSVLRSRVHRARAFVREQYGDEFYAEK